MNYKYEIVLKELNEKSKNKSKMDIKEKTIEVCKTKRSVNKIINDYINIKKSNKNNFEVKAINECSISKSKKI